MPIYEYSCPKCGSFEVTQRISDEPLRRCPTCRSKVRKLISATAFLLKGGGWYADGYQKPAAKSSASESGDSAKTASDTPATPATSDSPSSASKPAEPAAKKPAAKPSKPAKAAS